MSEETAWSMLGYCPEPDIQLLEDYLQAKRARVRVDGTVIPTYILRVHMDLEVTDPKDAKGLRTALEKRDVEEVVRIVKKIKPEVEGTAGEALLRAALLPKPSDESETGGSAAT